MIECAAVGVPAGIGEPMFDGLENKIAQAVFAIPAVRGIEFGSGFGCAKQFGSGHNDEFAMRDGKVVTLTNHHGGILGGISTGMPILFRAAFKPTPSIYRVQNSVNLSENRDATLAIKGRHDPCIVPARRAPGGSSMRHGAVRRLARPQKGDGKRMNLQDYRKRIDEIDAKLVALFEERMDIAAGVAQYKSENKLPVYDPAREREKLNDIGERVRPETRGYAEKLYSTIFELSRSHQRKLTAGDSALQRKIAEALKNTEPLFPERPLVACQGVEGAYSQQACEKLFQAPNMLYFTTFEGVFRAIDQGLCRYGVLPVENSTAGSVNRIYDLMMKYDFSIVRGARVKVDHCLLANKGAALSDIKEIVSHEQAIAQCEGFLKTLNGVKITPVENTALAAKMVFESGRADLAALSSRTCAELYSLSCLLTSVQDSASNFTRFICISKKLEIYPGANRTSVMVVLAHKPGSLYTALGRFYALGINLAKIESRPLPNSDFEFMFYFDLETSVYSSEFMHMIGDIEGMCAQFKYLGSYTEVI